jgi:hypothetical protein
MATVAKLSSPEYPKVPFPAIVEIILFGKILRIRLFPESAKYKTPPLVTHNPNGVLIPADVAGPSSPEKSDGVVPA